MKTSATESEALFTTDSFNVEVAEGSSTTQLTLEELFEQIVQLFDQNTVLR